MKEAYLYIKEVEMKANSLAFVALILKLKMNKKGLK